MGTPSESVSPNQTYPPTSCSIKQTLKVPFRFHLAPSPISALRIISQHCLADYGLAGSWGHRNARGLALWLPSVPPSSVSSVLAPWLEGTDSMPVSWLTGTETCPWSGGAGKPGWAPAGPGEGGAWDSQGGCREVEGSLGKTHLRSGFYHPRTLSAVPAGLCRSPVTEGCVWQQAGSPGQ